MDSTAKQISLMVQRKRDKARQDANLQERSGNEEAAEEERLISAKLTMIIQNIEHGNY